MSKIEQLLKRIDECIDDNEAAIEYLEGLPEKLRERLYPGEYWYRKILRAELREAKDDAKAWERLE